MAKDTDRNVLESMNYKEMEKSLEIKALVALYRQDHAQRSEPECLSKLKNLVTKYLDPTNREKHTAQGERPRDKGTLATLVRDTR